MIKVTGAILLFLSLFLSCKKDKNSDGEPLTNTHKMAGTHAWRRIISDTDTTYTITFDREIIVLNNSTITFPSSAAPTSKDTLRYAGSKNKTLTFTSQFDGSFYYYFEYDTMYYDYEHNTIEHVQYSTNKGKSGFVRLYTP